MPPKKVDSTFKKGEKVKARWSGSNAYFEAKIIDVFTKTCKVEFEDGTVSNVKLADIKSPKAEKTEKESPKRTRSRSRSTGRKSATSRSRSRSPARKEKKETVAKKEKKTPKSAEKEDNKKNNSIKKDETDSVFKSSLTREKIGGLLKEEYKSSTFTSSNSISKNLFTSLDKKDPVELRARSSRIAALRSADVSPSETKSFERSNAITKKDEGKYSDDEDSEEDVKILKKGPSKLLQTFHFIFTFLKIIAMPTSLLFLAFACTKKQCIILSVPQFYSRWRDAWMALKYPLPSVILFHIAVCLLSIIPVGKKVTGFPFGPKKSTREYYINGIFILLLSLIIAGVCSYFGVYMNWGYDKFKALTLSVLLYCAVCSLAMHIVFLIKGNGVKESKVPFIGNFFEGVYFNPFLFGKADIKTSFIRAGLISSVLINLSILLKFFFAKGYITIPLGCATGMQLFFVLDYFIREEKMLSTATYTSDCVGYAFLMTTGFLVPVGLTLQNVYLYNFEAKAHVTPYLCYASTLLLFFVGYYIYLMSSNLKHNFRNNPFSPALSGIESIPTRQKKRLISSKLWGFVRHPNYLGLILMVTAWALTCGFTHFAPYGAPLMLIIALILRTYTLEAECKEKYGPAWNNYAEKVRSRLIPYVF